MERNICTSANGLTNRWTMQSTKCGRTSALVVKSADTFEVSFDYTDAVRAQQTTRDLIAKLMYELVHGPAGDLTHDYLLQTFEIRDGRPCLRGPSARIGQS